MIIGKVINKFQQVYFSIGMFINGLRGLPAQTAKERLIFKFILDQFSDKKVRVFEWGSGFSTVYYAQYLKKNGVFLQWYAIDNNKVWHDKVAAMVRDKGLGACVSLYLKEFLPFLMKPDWGKIPPPCGVFAPKTDNEFDYINFPKTLAEKFDIVVIDARFRRRCLQVAKEVLAPGGVIVLHDAQKPHYHQGLEDFTFGSFYDTGSWYPFQKNPNQIWVGSMANQTILDILKPFVLKIK